MFGIPHYKRRILVTASKSNIIEHNVLGIGKYNSAFWSINVYTKAFDIFQSFANRFFVKLKLRSRKDFFVFRKNSVINKQLHFPCKKFVHHQHHRRQRILRQQR